MRIPDHYMTHNYFVFDGKSSMDFGLGISGSGTFTKPHRRVERFTVPGRHGTLTISDDTFEDVEITYPCYFADGFSARYDALCAWLFSKKGMVRLEDTYHPEHFRLAEFTGDISPDMGTLNFSGKFDLTFRCDGRKFLKSGDVEKSYDTKDYNLTGEYADRANGESVPVINPTGFASKPIVVVSGNSNITINETQIRIENYGTSIVLVDCESEEAYIKDTLESANQYIIATNGFPSLLAGENYVKVTSLNGTEKKEFALVPRWYVI